MPCYKRSRMSLTTTSSNDNTSLLASTDASQTANHPRTSFGDLKSPARLSLPRQSTFPEDIGTAADLPPLNKNRLPEMTSAGALNVDAGFGISSPTVNDSLECKRAASGASMESQRSPGLPALPGRMSKIDIEQAINFLQELKKTASPEELVSLHKALLPTTEVLPVPPRHPSSIEQYAAFSVPPGRTRSARPPGLVTRGRILEDPLRSQEEVATRTIKPKDFNEHHGAWFQETMSAVHARTCSMTSTGTAPDSSYSRTGGAFELGTLRITNGGAASPEPSMVPKLSGSHVEHEASAKPTRWSQEAAAPTQEERARRDSQHQRRDSQDSPTSGSSFSLAQCRQQQWGSHTSRSIYPPSSAAQNKFYGPLLNEAKYGDHQLFHSQKSNTANTPADLRVSTDIPRHEHRWHHRASHLSNEYMLDCDISSSPYDDQVRELTECAKRLSTVQDNDAEDYENASGVDARAQALLKLTGKPPLHITQDGSFRSPSPITATETDTKTETVPRFSFARLPRPRIVQKQDSGYCSEVSVPMPKNSSPDDRSTPISLETSLEKRSAASDSPALNITVSNPVHLNVVAAIPKSNQITETQGTATSMQGDLDTSRQQQAPAGMKRLSPLAIFKSRNRASKRPSIIVDASSTAARSNDAQSRSLSGQRPHPLCTKIPGGMRRKTLQKKMPEPVRQQRKAELENTRQSIHISGMTESERITDSFSTRPNQPRTSEMLMSPQTVIKHVPLARNASDADDEPRVGTPPNTNSSRSSVRRSKSFVPRTSKTVQEARPRDSPMPSVSSTPERRRSKSLSGSGSVLSKQSSIDVVAQSIRMRGNRQTAAESSDASFQSVARALETPPQEDGDNDAKSLVPEPVSRTSLRSEKSPQSLACKEQGVPVAQKPLPIRSHKSVEDLYPEWKSKPASQVSSLAAQEAPIANPFPPAVSRNYASEDIPPLPELPANLDFIICKSELMISKKLKNSPKNSPRGSARNSMDSDSKHNAANIPGQGNHDQDLGESSFAQTVVDEPPIAETQSYQELPVEADGKALRRRQFRFEPLAQTTSAVAVAEANSPTHDAQHSGWPGWEQQSTRWRQRNSVVGGAAELLGGVDTRPAGSSTANVAAGPDSPSIVVSRYITPPSSETTAHSTNSAHKNSSTVQVTRHPSGDGDKENDAIARNMHQSNGFVSTATYVTMLSPGNRPSTLDVSKTNGAVPHTMTTRTTTMTSLHTSKDGNATGLAAARNRTASEVSLHSKYVPYRPADSVHAERSRALNMARRSCQLKFSGSENFQSNRQPRLPKRASTDVFDRYGGGLAYGWNRQSGITGSAGTRNSATDYMNKKSVKMSEEWGLDLSDVPVFLQRSA